MGLLQLMGRIFLLLALVLGAAACKTVQVWDKGYPRSGKELKSEDAKRDEFNKFAIADGKVGAHGGGWIQTQKDRGSATYYSFGSFSSVVTKVSPHTAKNFKKIQTADLVSSIGLTLALIGVLASVHEDERSDIAKDVLYVTGFGTIIGASVWQAKLFADIKTKYHKGLNDEIYLGKKQASRNSDGALGVRLSFDLD